MSFRRKELVMKTTLGAFFALSFVAFSGQPAYAQQYVVVDLHPTGFSSSIITTTASGSQSGFATPGSFTHALLWSGTSDSAVDLNPSDFTTSKAWGTGGSTQVGDAAGLATCNQTPPRL